MTEREAYFPFSMRRHTGILAPPQPNGDRGRGQYER
jgi:hypothetical protein